MRRAILRLMLLSALLLFTGLAAPAQAEQRTRCFPETGYCVSGAILDYWEQRGGLSIFGYPISAVRTETVEGVWTGPVQWFERDRLEDHGRDGVMAGRLGARLLELQGRPWNFGSEKPRPGYSLCTLYAETGYNLCPPFAPYWRTQGGLERFGYPITPAFEETVQGRTYLVQYFERRRMEYHPENAGTPYEILLGLLGRDVLAREGGAHSQGVRFYWPTSAPIGLSVSPTGSYATDTMWALQLAEPHASEPSVTVSGNVGGGAPGSKLQDVTVRGQPGTAFRSGASVAVLWSEQGMPYAVVGKHDLRTILEIAEGLELVDRATWERRLRPE